MSTPFIKMHGTRNDFIMLDGFESRLPADLDNLARRICDRRRSVGADGLIAMTPPAVTSTDVDVTIRNADGSKATMCGNGARCVAVWMQHQERIDQCCRMRFASGLITATEISTDSRGGRATIEMGTATCQSLPSAVGSTKPAWHVNVGNSHVVMFTNDLSDSALHSARAAVDERFADEGGVNVELVTVLSTADRRLRARVYERGSGETQSCGSGACAVLSAMIQQGLASQGERWMIEFPGGILEVEQNELDQLLLSGPAEVSFQGVLPFADVPPA